MYKKCIFTLIVLCLAGGAYGASITIVDLPATGTDAAIGIDPGKAYTHAFDFGTNAPAVINGLAFDQGPTENVREQYVGVSSQGYGYILDDTRESVRINCHGGSDASDQADGNSAEMLRDMVYFSGAVVDEGIIITLLDLTPGTEYSVHWYYRAWDPELPRPITIIADGGESIDIDIDLGGAHYLDYTFVADDNDVTMEFITNNDNQGVHLYGLTCEEVPVALKTAAMIVNPADLTAGFDAAQKDRLESLGYAVTVVQQDDVTGGVFTAADAETFDVLVVSESIGSSAANNLIGANVPMMHQESYGWSRHFFTQGLNKVWLNDPDGMMDVVNDVHPIIADAGVSAGPVKFFNNPAASWTTDTVASLVPGAENLAQLTSEGEDYTLIFTIEAGTELADASLAANRIVGFSIPGNESFVAGDMTDEAWALFDAAIAWLDPAPVEIPAMVAHWTMDDVSGTVVTDSAGGNDGEIVGNVSWIDGVLGGAVTFDNSDPNAAIVIPHSEVLDFGDVDFSISMMVRYPVVPADAEHQLIMKGSFGSPDSGSRYTLFNKNGEFRFEIDNGPANVKSGIKIANAPVVTGEWVHVVLVRDAVNDLLSMYIDGVLMTSGADSSGDISSGEEMRIGNTTVGNGRTCEADIDDVRIFPSALTENEIAAIASLY